MSRKLISILTASVFALTLAMTACGPKDGGQKKTVKILYPNWAEGIAVTHLAKVALEDKGYKVDIKPIEPGPIYQSLAKGDADLFLDAWLPHTHADYWDKYGDKLVKLGESFSGGTTGIVVPKYVDIDSINELPNNKEKFDGKIIGIGSGAGIHKNTEKAIKKYNLPFKQITSSGPAMVASLAKAVKKKEWIAITGWKPHFMWANYDLKYLNDPLNVYPKDVMAILARQGFKSDFPKLTKFMGNFNFKEKQLYSLMKAVKQGDDEVTAAKNWYQKNKTLVNGWW
jgi:glycine betaine/proline transport system substrate-binding protein